MQKTYWWRILVLALSGFVLVSGWIYESYFCFLYNGNCPLEQFRLPIFEPMVITAIFLFITSIFLFFTSDTVFLKWLKFAIVWLALAAIFIAFAPVYSGGFIGFSPTKETISIWMGSLFVILSLIQIIWQSRKENQC